MNNRLVRRLLHLLFLLRRPLTLGTRVAAFDGAGRVFLVRHTYVSGWHLPGGGVDPGETIEESARREMAEEGNLVCDEPLRLISLHFNRRASRRDHVALFVAHDVRQFAPRPPDREIAESGFFPLSGLPDDTTPATRARLSEVQGAARSDPFW